MKKTRWISGKKFKPARIGIYEVGYWGQWKYWNGTFWGAASPNRLVAVWRASIRSIDQNAKWRGLAEKPSKRGVK